MSKRKQKPKPPVPKCVPSPAPADLAGMLALSCRQPWAEFIVAGKKTIEHRSQPIALRGCVLIYASLGRRSAEWEEEVADEWDFDVAELDPARMRSLKS